MRRRRARLVGVGVCLALGFACAVLLLLFPHPVFPYSRELEGLRLRSDGALGGEIDAELRDARDRWLGMELHRPGDRHTLFLSQGQGLYRFYCSIARKPSVTQGVIVSSLTRTVILSAPGIRQMRERTGGRPAHSRFEGSLAAAIAHEIAHLQAARELGLQRTRSLPAWKNEGWADYSAHRVRIREDPSYDLAERLDLLQDETDWRGSYPAIDRRHFRWQLLVEFLVEVRGLSFGDLVADSLTEDDTWAELTSWHTRQQDRQARPPIS